MPWPRGHRSRRVQRPPAPSGSDVVARADARASSASRAVLVCESSPAGTLCSPRAWSPSEPRPRPPGRGPWPSPPTHAGYSATFVVVCRVLRPPEQLPAVGSRTNAQDARVRCPGARRLAERTDGLRWPAPRPRACRARPGSSSAVSSSAERQRHSPNSAPGPDPAHSSQRTPRPVGVGGSVAGRSGSAPPAALTSPGRARGAGARATDSSRRARSRSPGKLGRQPSRMSRAAPCSLSSTARTASRRPDGCQLLGHSDGSAPSVGLLGRGSSSPSITSARRPPSLCRSPSEPARAAGLRPCAMTWPESTGPVSRTERCHHQLDVASSLDELPAPRSVWAVSATNHPRHALARSESRQRSRVLGRGERRWRSGRNPVSIACSSRCVLVLGRLSAFPPRLGRHGPRSGRVAVERGPPP